MLYTYDPKLLVIAFAGVPIVGYADGTFLTVERSNNMWTMVSGASGETSRAKSNDKTGTAVLTLKQTSPSNDVLSSLALVDETTNLGVFPFIAKDALGTATMFSALGFIQKIPSMEFGKEIANREWTIMLSGLMIFVGGNFPTI
jgi:hypothetical protein